MDVPCQWFRISFQRWLMSRETTEDINHCLWSSTKEVELIQRRASLLKTGLPLQILWIQKLKTTRVLVTITPSETPIHLGCLEVDKFLRGRVICTVVQLLTLFLGSTCRCEYEQAWTSEFRTLESGLGKAELTISKVKLIHLLYNRCEQQNASSDI